MGTLLDSIASGVAVTCPSTPDGYEMGPLLGRGGMGVVVLANDPRIGRQVAIKRMRADAGGEAEARFLREAQIQARLDHPAIVPVYEIGRDDAGRPFFTMKRLTGTTLADILATQCKTQQALLRAFVDVCNAIDFAHSRGIVHRDLKPENIMLGDFGEVYVLDWGVARVLHETEHAPLERVATDSGQTEAGALLGTPGYMPPEQARGEAVGTSADVYALGSILFEILARQPLHPRGAAAIYSTLQSPTAAPSDRRRDVPPELCMATLSALAGIAADRPTARALADRVQAYLDGDRDLARRREIARNQLELARAAFAANDRGVAMQTAGRALALDPECAEAAQLITSLTLEAPAENPPELEAHLAAVDLQLARAQWRPAAIAWLAFFVPLPLLLIAGITEAIPIVAFYVAVVSLSAVSFYWSKRGTPRVSIAMALAIPAMVLLSRLFGPFTLVPTLLAIIGYAFTAYPTQMRRPMAVLAMSATLLAILALEHTGVLEKTWQIVGGAIVTRSTMIDLSGVAGKALLITSNIIAILFSAMFASRIAVQRYDANRRLEIQAWHLRKLVPA